MREIFNKTHLENHTLARKRGRAASAR